MFLRIGYICILLVLLNGCSTRRASVGTADLEPVDYVNVHMGNISHLLVPTYPTIHLPNSMLRVYPERYDYTSDQINGLPLIVTSHRGSSAFNLSPIQVANGTNLKKIYPFSYDNEVVKPYYYEVDLDESATHIRYAPSHQSAIYHVQFAKSAPSYLIFNTRNGHLRVEGNKVYASQNLGNNTTVYLFAETDVLPIRSGLLTSEGAIDEALTEGEGKNVASALEFGGDVQSVHIRYGISFIDQEQAERNLRREIKTFDLQTVADYGRSKWNEALRKIEVQGANKDDKVVFYTSLYRCFERAINLTEDGRYFSAFDGKVHEDEQDFYTDDWIWDTYRATHPLRVLIDEQIESDIINSFIRMAEQMDNFWLPTFPEVNGDSRRMNSNHGVATIADAYAKGLRSFDLEKAYQASRNAIMEKTLAPWSADSAGWLDNFYREHGYIPALAPQEKESVPEVHRFEKRQPIAVTLGTAYDEWCLAELAEALGKKDDEQYFRKQALNYRNVYNHETGFFHPKDKEGFFIEPFDYRYSGGQGARDYYGENNAWIYRWDVPHNVADLVQLMGGRESFAGNLNQTFREPLGKGKYQFYSQLPDHTGNVGQFSMANEPSLHIPYLYNYVGQPWMTQKRIRTLLHQWFRNDLMGVPGDEDGGGMSAFVVFSMMGFYPVTPGMPMYTIGSPFFEKASITLSNGKVFTVSAKNYSKEHKYIQEAYLNGEKWTKTWFAHDDLAKGGELVLVMGKHPNTKWGAQLDDSPPSFKMP
ncbi:GH92 family glycosyl hydrolase [Sphingobacterium wenxiniae]|uniref:Alpha-1,2-mannosidase, putative n=1 Tax=Sphingobacterium wenxiniae TaxID=683125 RepID=A0A1I6TUT8_9SPHI|nr:GH92 family glycosyl hydrolase [Sphingobacterium wenxiniae]SFS92931.1 alpha-1,2-mannosidase, putative [Sphingobacterium wenxiniae]